MRAYTFGSLSPDAMGHDAGMTSPFPLTSTAEEIQAWRTKIKNREEPVDVQRGTFAADVADYLARKKAMPSFKQRQRFMSWWIDQIGGTRPSRTITAQEISVALQNLLVRGQSPATVKLIRSALSNFFTTLWGRASANPVRDVPTPRQHAARIRSVPYATIVALLDACPRCPSRARLALMGVDRHPARPDQDDHPCGHRLDARRTPGPRSPQGRRHQRDHPPAVRRGREGVARVRGSGRVGRI